MLHMFLCVHIDISTFSMHLNKYHRSNNHDRYICILLHCALEPVCDSFHTFNAIHICTLHRLFTKRRNKKQTKNENAKRICECILIVFSTSSSIRHADGHRKIQQQQSQKEQLKFYGQNVELLWL